MSLVKDLIVLGIDTIDLNKFQKIKNSRSRNKPIGGLWTSPVNSEYGWKDFVESESYKKDRYLNDCVLISLKDSAKIFKIDSNQDFKEAPKRSTEIGETDWYPPIKYLDFEKLAEDYDALWLTYNGVKDLSYFDGDLLIGDLYGWDVETVLLFNLDCIESYA